MSSKKNLFDDKYHLYAGKCKHCGHKEEWIVGKAMSWQDFSAVIELNKFPQFIEACPECNNLAVFDLTAYSRLEELKEIDPTIPRVDLSDD